jgi:E3 ubiquitin-protein ligase Topors
MSSCEDGSGTAGDGLKDAEGKDIGISDDENDERCPICLSDFDNKAFLDNCFHPFCYFCVLQWSDLVQTCPLCKKPFSSIIHNVRSSDQYDQHFVEQKKNEKDKVEQQPFTSERFRYQSTMSGRHLQGNRFGARQQRRAAAQERRKAIYSANLWVTSPLVSSDGIVRVRDISSGFFKSNPAATHRLIPFLIREMRVLLGNDLEHVHFVVQLILSLIDKIDIDSEEFKKHLEPFLFERTAHFLHEFTTFAESPFDLKAFDDQAKYNFLDTGPTHQLPPSDAPSTSATAAIRERLMAELAFETPYEISPPKQRRTSGLTSSWESPPTIIIDSSDDNENSNENPAIQSQKTAERPSFTSSSKPNTEDNDPNLHSDGQKRKRSKRRARDRHVEGDNYEYYEEERVVRRKGADGHQTEERWFVSSRKGTWSDSEHRHPKSAKFRKHSRHMYTTQRQSRKEEHTNEESVIRDSINLEHTNEDLAARNNTNKHTNEEPVNRERRNPEPSYKLPKLRSVVFAVSRKDQENPKPQQMDTPTEQRANSPTCEELEQELEALDSGIHAAKSQLLRVLQRIEDMKAAQESQGQQ